MPEVKTVWEISALLGEGPVWVEAENAVYWVDIFSNQVHRYSLADGAKKTWTFDLEVTSSESATRWRFCRHDQRRFRRHRLR